jgi:protein gp37
MDLKNKTKGKFILDCCCGSRMFWFGASVSNQETADKLIPQLLQVNGKRFLSIEPQLLQIDLRKVPVGIIPINSIQWIIQGGESGHGKRPFNLEWAYDMKSRCKAANIPYFFKQIDKVQPIPDDLQIREFPNF